VLTKSLAEVTGAWIRARVTIAAMSTGALFVAAASWRNHGGEHERQPPMLLMLPLTLLLLLLVRVPKLLAGADADADASACMLGEGPKP